MKLQKFWAVGAWGEGGHWGRPLKSTTAIRAILLV